jgi:hypothetical protein
VLECKYFKSERSSRNNKRACSTIQKIEIFPQSVLGYKKTVGTKYIQQRNVKEWFK